MSGEIRCRDCRYMQMTGRARSTRNNRGHTPRGLCYCKHPNARNTFEQICPRSNRSPGFIGFTSMGGSSEPQTKTAPRWCPRKNVEQVG